MLKIEEIDTYLSAWCGKPVCVMFEQCAKILATPGNDGGKETTNLQL